MITRGTRYERQSRIVYSQAKQVMIAEEFRREPLRICTVPCACMICRAALTARTLRAIFYHYFSRPALSRRDTKARRR